MIVLGIESSCDETGAALISDTKGLLADALHTQIDMHRAYGGNAQPKSHSVRDCIACQQCAGKARPFRHGNGGDI